MSWITVAAWSEASRVRGEPKTQRVSREGGWVVVVWQVIAGAGCCFPRLIYIYMCNIRGDACVLLIRSGENTVRKKKNNLYRVLILERNPATAAPAHAHKYMCNKRNTVTVILMLHDPPPPQLKIRPRVTLVGYFRWLVLALCDRAPCLWSSGGIEKKKKRQSELYRIRGQRF